MSTFWQEETSGQSSPLYQICLLTLFLITPPTFLSLQFLTAPYGRHLRPNWGPTLPSPLAWFLMESPSLFLPLLLFHFPSDQLHSSLRSVSVLSLFLLHYSHRTLIYPLRLHLRQSPSQFPISVASLAFLFNLLNSFVQTKSISHHNSNYNSDPLFWPRFTAGSAVFFAGMALNIWSDSVLVKLKSEGKGYRIPIGGAYEFVSCPNYLGEIVEWAGFAIVSWSWAGLGFFLYTCANLVPRARANHVWYLEKFGEDYPKARKAVIPFLY